MLNAGDQSGATARIGDLEYEWDNAQARLKPKDAAAWTEIDGRIDTVLRELRAANPNTGPGAVRADRIAGRARLATITALSHLSTVLSVVDGGVCPRRRSPHNEETIHVHR